MHQSQAYEQERSLFRAGGIAGILGSLIFVLVFIIVGVFVGEDPVELEAFVTVYPGIETAKFFENGLYLLVLLLWIPHAVALGAVLKTKALAPALFGAAIGIAGLVIMAAGALTHVAHGQMADLYYAAGVTPEDRSAIALIWQAIWGIFDALLIAGLAFMPFSLFSFGLAMRKHPNFSLLHWGLSLGLGLVGLVATMLSMVDPNSPAASLVVFGLIIFHVVIGWKLIRLSGQPVL